MTALIVALYAVQLLAVFYAGLVCLDVTRVSTFGKNVDWIIDNQEFLRTYRRPQLWPLATVTSLLLAATLVAARFGSYSEVFWTKNAGLVLGTALLFLFYYLREKRVANLIPARATRTASLAPRTLAQYLPRNVHRAVHVLVAGIVAADFVLLWAGRIGLDTLAVNLAAQALGFGGCYWGLWYSLRQKSLHKEDIASVTDQDLDGLSRRFNIATVIVAFYVLIVLNVLDLTVQYLGYGFNDPFMSLVSRLLGSQNHAVKTLDSRLWDAVWTAISIPLFVWIVNTKVFREIRKISFEKKIAG